MSGPLEFWPAHRSATPDRRRSVLYDDRSSVASVPKALLEDFRGTQPGAEPLPPRSPDAVRLVTLNVAHGRRRVLHQAFVRRSTTKRNLDAVAQTLVGVGPDVVALQEADGPSAWSGNFDHVAALAAESRLDDHFRGDHNPFHVGRRQLASGTALLARWQLCDPHSERFGTTWRCTKGFVVATVAIPAWGGLEIDLVSVHLDFLKPNLRRRQIEAMSNSLADRGRPLIMLGDLNCCWRHEPRTLALLCERLGLHAHAPSLHRPTYPAYLPRRRLDWILLSEELTFVHHRRLPVKLSDHLGVVADVRLTRTM